MKNSSSIRSYIHSSINGFIACGITDCAKLMVGVVDSSPGCSDSIITSKETIGSADCPNKINRWMSVGWAIGHSKTNGYGAGNVGDFGGRDSA
jgi:hypothetical protein